MRAGSRGAPEFWDRLLAASAAAALAALIVALKARNVASFWYDPLLQVYSLVAGGYVLSRVLLSAFYREPEDRSWHPTASVIISVKNEERQIEKTIDSVFA